ncbi:MAG: S-adenosylmethionine decarboxylase proenzyme [Elusimicrobia bacterium RIFCSPLOWO2_02_FULL_39_32]|nr:MAG: S-adenosylmethionine decarboxylase proenzyme [Elusimicrobia bacterium GWA2_38_7]OGR78462.1 MAG: S-adenosylmethionine decarboxylase proenzyme [Elusimicrobia bacterium RIFCSPHIGHO2_02_FULL_39_36]OGR92221.1 MAG: S-adenosylmethionine decarboxylase proenzyme [Elusimicrobia bacterium RIFCSPLOWO2_02_FULL_39_32]OGR99912.1 MAG: S-adenosylmethionine decarboxylase proenzyme [Elusimicrobia bacterium RIFCSPLOWO2_12_FULL_39_28]
MKCLGRHLLVEYYSCNPKILMDVSRIEDLLVGAAKYAKAHIVDVVFHTFNPHGVSGVVVVEESHLAIHTWPEHKFASVDIYTCGDSIDPWQAYKYLLKGLKAKHSTATEMKRGVLHTKKDKKSIYLKT